MMSPCSIWQELKREGTYVYTKEGTKVPSLNTGGLVRTRVRRKMLGRRVQIYLISSRSLLFASIPNWMRSNMTSAIFIFHRLTRPRLGGERGMPLRKLADLCCRIFTDSLQIISRIFSYKLAWLLRSFRIIPSFLNQFKRAITRANSASWLSRGSSPSQAPSLGWNCLMTMGSGWCTPPPVQSQAWVHLATLRDNVWK